MPIIFSAAIMAGAAAFASSNHADLAKPVEPSTLPTIIVDSRFNACSTEEQNYFFPRKAEKRLAKLENILRKEERAYRVLRWAKDDDVLSEDEIKSLGPIKYLRNC